MLLALVAYERGLSPLEFASNLSAELGGIALTILLIDHLISRRELLQHKRQLSRQMSSRDNGTALSAVEELRASGWLTDGSLAGAYLRWANLQHSDLRKANLERIDFANAILSNVRLGPDIVFGYSEEDDDPFEEPPFEAVVYYPETEYDFHELERNRVNLRNANLAFVNLSSSILNLSDLRGANLYGAKLHGIVLFGANLHQARYLNDSQLSKCSVLTHTTMPDGSRYDGRFCLEGDLRLARDYYERELLSDRDMAAWHGVTLNVYEAGQAWASKHLAQVRDQAEIVYPIIYPHGE
jgi:uncharacterized protein YjbI with pentapeptide repeats